MIDLHGVSVHNLKHVSLRLRQGELIVFTGVSGSGKSSMAFDTIYVEGQRRYIDSLSAHAKRYMGDLPKPDALSLEGIPPTIAIEQKAASHNPKKPPFHKIGEEFFVLPLAPLQEGGKDNQLCLLRFLQDEAGDLSFRKGGDRFKADRAMGGGKPCKEDA